MERELEKIDVKKIPDNARLQLMPKRGPAKKIQHNKRHAQCLAWVAQSRTMGEYRKFRRDAGLTPNGGYIGYFLRTGTVVHTLPKKS